MSTPEYPQQQGEDQSVPNPALAPTPDPTLGAAPVSAPAPEPAAYPQSFPAPQAQPGPPTGTTLGQTNTFAFLSIILAFIAPIAGIIFGHLGLNQIKRTGDSGRGIALTGLILSYAYFVMVFVLIVFYIGFLIMLLNGLGNNLSDLGSHSDYSNDLNFDY